jgi:hypothetical protein
MAEMKFIQYQGVDIASNVSSILLSAAEAVQIRSEVSSILNSMIDDIDVTHMLQEQLDHRQIVSNLEHKYNAAQMALEEYRLLVNKSSRQRIKLADTFTQQLWALDSDLNHFQQKTKDCETKARLYDQIIELLNNRSPTDGDYHQMVEVFRNIISQRRAIGNDGMPSNDRQLLPNISTSSNSEEEHCEQGNVGSIPSAEVLDPCEKLLPSVAAIGTTTFHMNDISYLNACPLDQLSDKDLMNIFNFMTADDILNFAQTSVRFYSKVDRLFGLDANDETTVHLGSAPSSRNIDGENGVQQMSISEEKEAGRISTHSHVFVKPQNPTEECLSRNTESLSKSTTGATSNASALDLTEYLDTNEKVRSKWVDSNNNGGGHESKGVRAIGSLSHVLTLLPVDKSSFGGLIKSKTNGRRADGYQSYQNNDPWSAVKVSLVSKLTPTELSAIISLRDERKKCMSDMEQLLIESNDLKQRLSGFESQRNHLMENISILETSLQQKNEEFRLLHDELRSDQEVIAFLDQRVHDLETKCQALEEEKTRAMSTVDAIKNATQKQLIVMGDMLKFERENLNENEKEWKATKKVLVKEIKNCRAQILTLQSERDAYSEQCAKYREALLQSGGFSSFKER